MDSIGHLIVLCCYGGQPFLDFSLGLVHRETMLMDPTDWIATDIAGSLLENSTLPVEVMRIASLEASGTKLRDCDLFNVTFTSSDDQHYFTENKAGVRCRCAPGYSGASCESAAPLPPQALKAPPTRQSNMMLIVVGAVLLALFLALICIMKGCFCDCFGPLSFSVTRPGGEPYDKPLERDDVEKCLRRYREQESRRQMTGDPLISTVESGVAPYPVGPATSFPSNQGFQSRPGSIPSAPPPPATTNTHYRPPSPPPSYSSLADSRERLPTTHI